MEAGRGWEAIAAVAMGVKGRDGLRGCQDAAGTGLRDRLAVGSQGRGRAMAEVGLQPEHMRGGIRGRTWVLTSCGGRAVNLALSWWPMLWKQVQLLTYLRKQSICSGFEDVGRDTLGWRRHWERGPPANTLRGNVCPSLLPISPEPRISGNGGTH